MVTLIEFDEYCSDGLWFKFNDGQRFKVRSLKDGVMFIEHTCDCTINSFAKNIAGCFKKGSNFYGLKAIEFEFNDARVLVTEDNADPDKIYRLWNEAFEKTRINVDE